MLVSQESKRIIVERKRDDEETVIYNGWNWFNGCAERLLKQQLWKQRLFRVPESPHPHEVAVVVRRG